MNTTQQAPPTGNAVPPDKTAGSNAVNPQSRPDGLVGGDTQVLGKVKWAFGNWLPPPRPIARPALNLNQTSAPVSPSSQLPVRPPTGKEKTGRPSDGDWILAKKERTSGSPNSSQATTSTVPTHLEPHTADRYCQQSVSLIDWTDQSVTAHDTIHGVLRRSDVASGDIVRMKLDLQRLGFHKDNEWRCFVVLGGTYKKGLIVLPISTYSGRGKSRFKRRNDRWKQDYFKSMKTAIFQSPDENEDLTDVWNGTIEMFEDDGGSDDDEMPDMMCSLTPHQPLFCTNFKCLDGTVVALANAFVVNFDQADTMPAHKAGFLTPDSFKDLWHCHEHLLDDHSEMGYLLGTEADSWEFNMAQQAIKYEQCRLDQCSLGSKLKSSVPKDH